MAGAIAILNESQLEELTEKVAESAAEKVLLKTYQPFPEWMNVGQVAKYLGIAENTVRAKIREGLPVNEKLGFKRFNKLLVDQWMNSKT